MVPRSKEQMAWETRKVNYLIVWELDCHRALYSDVGYLRFHSAIVQIFGSELAASIKNLP